MLVSAMMSHMMLVMLALALPACKDLEGLESPLERGQTSSERSELSLQPEGANDGKEERGSRKPRAREEVRHDGIHGRESSQGSRSGPASEKATTKVDFGSTSKSRRSSRHDIPDRHIPLVNVEAHNLGANPDEKEVESPIYDYDTKAYFLESSVDKMDVESFDDGQLLTATLDPETTEKSLRLPRSPTEKSILSDPSDRKPGHSGTDNISVREEQDITTTMQPVGNNVVESERSEKEIRDMVTSLRVSRRLLKKRLRKEKSQVTNVADVLISRETPANDSSGSSTPDGTTSDNVPSESHDDPKEVDFVADDEGGVDYDDDGDTAEGNNHDVEINTKKTSNIQKKSRAKCTDIPGYPQSGLLVVWRCPSSWKDRGVRRLCQAKKSLHMSHVVDGDVINGDVIPAWGRDGRLYGNVHCAQCNGAFPARTWDLFLDCNPWSKVRLIQGQSNITLLKDFPRNASACQSRLEPGAGVTLPICGESGSRSSHTRGRRSVTDYGSVMSYPVSFSVLMNFGFDGKTHILFSSTHETPRQTTVPKCAANHVYDPYSHSCRAITCPAGYTLVRDSCMPTVRDEAASSDTVDLSALTQMSDTKLVTLDVNLTADLVWYLSSPHFTDQMVKGISQLLRIRPERIQNLTASWQNASEAGPVVQIHPIPVVNSPTPTTHATQGHELIKDDERPPRALMGRKEQFRVEGGSADTKDLRQIFAPIHEIFDESDDDGGSDGNRYDNSADDRLAKRKRRGISSELPKQMNDVSIKTHSRMNTMIDTDKGLKKGYRSSDDAEGRSFARRSEGRQEKVQTWRQSPGGISPNQKRGRRSPIQTSSKSPQERSTVPAYSSITSTAISAHREGTSHSTAATQATALDTNTHESGSAQRWNSPSPSPSIKGTESKQKLKDMQLSTAIPHLATSESVPKESATQTTDAKKNPFTISSNTTMLNIQSTVTSQTATRPELPPYLTTDSSETTPDDSIFTTSENTYETDTQYTTTPSSNTGQNDAAATVVTAGYTETPSKYDNLDWLCSPQPASSESPNNTVPATAGNSLPVDPELRQCSKGANKTMACWCREQIKLARENKLLLRISFILLPEQTQGEATVQDLLELMNRLLLDHMFRIDLGDGEPMVDVVSLTNKDQPIVMDTFCSRGVKDIHFDDEFALIPHHEVTSGNFTMDVYVNRTRQIFHEGQYDLTVMVEGTTRDPDLTNVAFVFVCLLPRLRDKHCARMALLESEFTLLPNKSISFSGRLYNMSQYEWTDEVTGSVDICVPEEYFRPLNVSRARSVIQGCDKDFESFSKAEGYLSAVLGRLSIVAMAAVVLTYILFPRMRNLPGINTLNLTLALLLAEVLFFLGEDSSVPELCSAVAVALHFFFLASFFWMNVMTFDLFRTFANTCILTRMRSKRKYLWRYALYAWGCPLVVVLVCVVLDFSGLAPPDIIGYGGYHRNSNLTLHRDDCNESEAVSSAGGNSTRLRPRLGSTASMGCWIQNPSATLLAFGAPMLLVFIVNAVLFVRTIIAIRATAKLVHLSTRRSSLRHLTGRHDVMLYVRMSTVMGFTWAFGLASALVSATGHTEPTRALCLAVHILGILFNIFNCSQGLFIFVAFTLKRRIFLLYKGLFARMKAWTKMKMTRRSRSRPSSCSSSSSANTAISVLSDAARNSPIVHQAVGASVSAYLEEKGGKNLLQTSGLVLGRSAPPLLLSWSSFGQGKFSSDYSSSNRAFVDDDGDLLKKITFCDENQITDKLSEDKKVNAQDIKYNSAQNLSDIDQEYDEFASDSSTKREDDGVGIISSKTAKKTALGSTQKKLTPNESDYAQASVHSREDSLTRGRNRDKHKVLETQRRAVDPSAIEIHLSKNN